MMNPFEDFNRRFVSQLRQEVEEWQQDGTISAEQGQAILARYPADSVGYEAARRRQGLVVGLSILGAVLVGLGIITFFAANWDEIPRSVKLGALVAGVVLSYGAGFFLWQRLGYTAVGIALVLLGCIIYGAGVHLIGQIYHVPVDHPNLTAFWFLGVLPLAYVTRSKPVMFLAIVLFLVAAGFRLPHWLEDVYDADAVILASVMYLALAALLYAIGKAKSLFDEWEPIGGLFRAIGLIVGFGALYLLTFHDLIDEAGRIRRRGLPLLEPDLRRVGHCRRHDGRAGMVARPARGRLGCRAFRDSNRRAAADGLPCACVRVPVGWEPLYPIVINALFALAALGLMVSGYLQGREGRINLALGLIALFVISRYFEYSTTLFDRSLVFVGAGVILLAGGFLLERGRRRMLTPCGPGRVSDEILGAHRLLDSGRRAVGVPARLHRRQGSSPPHRHRGRAANRPGGPALPAARRLRHPGLRNRRFAAVHAG